MSSKLQGVAYAIVEVLGMVQAPSININACKYCISIRCRKAGELNLERLLTAQIDFACWMFDLPWFVSWVMVQDTGTQAVQIKGVMVC